MRSSRRVFSSPIEVQTQIHMQIRRMSLQVTSSPLRLRPHARLCNLLVSHQEKRNVSLQVAEKSRHPRDDEITSGSVTVVDEEGKLTAPRSTRFILSSIDRKTHSLVVVVPGEPGVPPICKIFNKQKMREAERARLKAARTQGVTLKTMQLNWAIGKNDLKYRMDKLRGWLEKGWRVEVDLTGKRKGKQASESEGEALVAHVRKLLEECKGREMKPAEGKNLDQLTLYLEGRQGQKGKGAAQPVVEPVACEESVVAKGTTDASEEVTEVLKPAERGEGESSRL